MKRAAAYLTPIAALSFAACANVPGPPAPVPAPDAPRVEVPSLELIEPPPPIEAPRALPPLLRWVPAQPGEGTLVTLLVEPTPRALPLLEAAGRVEDDELELAPLPGGAYLGLVAAPLDVDEVPIEVTVTAIDGTRITQSLNLHVASREFPVTRLRVAPRFTAPDAATLERIQRERTVVRATLRTASDRPLWRGAFELPLIGVTTSPYGQRRLFNDELRSRHTGRDIDGDTGDPVYAANSGRVVLSRDLFFNGRAVFVDHGLGLYTGYFHLSKREVGEGEWVEKGDLIGLVGATGRVTGSHLHWSVYLRGVPLDPLSILEPEFVNVSRRLMDWTVPDAPTTNP